VLAVRLVVLAAFPWIRRSQQEVMGCT